MDVIVKAYFEGASKTPSKFFLSVKGKLSQISEESVHQMVRNGYNVTISRTHQIPS